MLSSSIIERPIKKTYKEWWNSPVETIAGYRVNNKKQIITNGMYVRDYYNRLTNILKSKGYEIDNENELKNEVATFIYNLSDDDI